MGKNTQKNRRAKKREQAIREQDARNKLAGVGLEVLEKQQEWCRPFAEWIAKRFAVTVYSLELGAATMYDAVTGKAIGVYSLNGRFRFCDFENEEVKAGLGWKAIADALESRSVRKANPPAPTPRHDGKPWYTRFVKAAYQRFAVEAKENQPNILTVLDSSNSKEIGVLHRYKGFRRAGSSDFTGPIPWNEIIDRFEEWGVTKTATLILSPRS